MLLLHGIPGSGATWARVVEELPDDLDVVVPDLLGFGGSVRPQRFDELWASAQAAALQQLLDELGLRGVVVVGHDFGGPVALALSARAPGAVCGVGLLAANAFPDTPIPFPLSLVTAAVVGPVARALLLSPPALSVLLRRGTGPGVTPPAASTHVGDAAQQRAIATIFAGALTRLAELYAPVEQNLRGLDIPVFVGWGDHDPFFPLAQGERTAGAAGTALRVYAGAGHFIPHEQPSEVARDIASFVAATVG